MRNLRNVALCVALVGAVACTGQEPSPAPASSSHPAASGATSGGPSPETEALLLQPDSLAFDDAGNLYVSEYGGNVVDMIGTDGVASVIAGTGTPGYSGDGGRATAATLSSPAGLAFAPDGSLVIADNGNDRLRAVTPDGTMTTIAGTDIDGPLGDGGPAVDASIDNPAGVAFDARGNLLVADLDHSLIREIAADGTISTFAGGGRTPAGDASSRTGALDLSLGAPAYVVATTDATIFSDLLDNTVWSIDDAGRATVLAGGGPHEPTTDEAPATDVWLDFPLGVAVGDATLFVSDGNRNEVLALDLSDGTIAVVAGDGTSGDGGIGGPATQAQLSAPSGLAVGPDGLLYIADQGNDRVVRIEADGRLTLVAT